MNSTQISVFLGESIYPDQARALTAKLLTGTPHEPLVSAFMNYRKTGSAGQVAVSGFSPVKFAGLRDGFRLIGFGEEGVQLVNSLAGGIAVEMCKHFKRAISVDSKSISTEIEWQSYPVAYTVPKMVVQKKPSHLARLASQETGKPMIEALIERSIRDQASALNLKVPNNLKVNFLGAPAGFVAKLGHGSAAFAALKGARFECNATLSGLWSIGYLTSKGYGLLNADFERSGARHVSQ